MVAGWTRLAHTKLGSANATIDTGTFDAKEHLQVIIYTLSASVDHYCYIRYNGDGASNRYTYLKNANGEVPDGSPNLNMPYNDIYVHTRNGFYVMDITNYTGKEKLGIMQNIGGSTGKTNPPARREYVSKWVNTSDQITQITVHQGNGSNTFDADSYITVWGRSDDVTSDEKATLADATATRNSTLTHDGTDITSLTWTELGSSTSDASYVLENSSSDIIDIKNSGNNVSGSFGYATLPSTLSSTAWLMRFKLVFNTVTAESTGGKSFFSAIRITDSGTSGEGVGSEDGFGFWFIADAGSTQTQFRSTTNGSETYTGMSYTPASGNTIYVEISYSSGTATANFYSDSGFSSRVGSTTANATQTGTHTGLKYPQVMLRQDSGGNGVMEMELSELKIYDGNSTLTSVVSTAPPAGTRYEETDTRKIYRREGGLTSSDADHSFDFANNTGWTFSDSQTSISGGKFQINKTNGTIDGHRGTYDLGSALSSTFIFRFKANFSTLGLPNNGSNYNLYIGVRSTAGVNTNSNDHCSISFDLQDQQDLKVITSLVGDDQTYGSGDWGDKYPSSGSISEDTDYYCTFIKTSTGFTLQIRSGSHTGTLLHNVDKASSKNPTGLQYVWIGWSNRGSNTGADWVGTLDDFEIYDGVTSLDASWKERGTA